MLSVYIFADTINVFFGLHILAFDLFGVFFGLVIFILIAVFLNGVLAGSLSLSYGASYPTSIFLLHPFLYVNYPYLFYFAYLGGFLVLAIFFVVLEPKFALIRQFLFKPRI